MSWNGFTEEWLRQREGSQRLSKPSKASDMVIGEIKPKQQAKLPHSQAKATIRSGYHFPSKLEADRFTEQCLLRATGEVLWFIRQTPFHFPDGNKMVVDFFVFWQDGSYTIEDTKGRVLPAFKRKLKSFKYFYPTLELTLLYRKDVERFSDEQHELLTRKAA